MSYKLSILRSDEGNGGSVERFFFEYPQPVPGEGRFIHTYRCDGSPIPSFSGEPEKVKLSGDIDTFTNMLWNSLNESEQGVAVRAGDRAENRQVQNAHREQIRKSVTAVRAERSFDMKELELKYGCNPNQKPARIFMAQGELPVQVLNGRPGYINFLDALNSWQLVKELKEATGLPAAASFKHVSPAGAALGLPLTDAMKKMYFVEGLQLSPLACAYARPRCGQDVLLRRLDCPFRRMRRGHGKSDPA